MSETTTTGAIDVRYYLIHHCTKTPVGILVQSGGKDIVKYNRAAWKRVSKMPCSDLMRHWSTFESLENSLSDPTDVKLIGLDLETFVYKLLAEFVR